MKIYEAYKSGWDTFESFGLFKNKDSAQKELRKQAGLHNKYFKKTWGDHKGSDMLTPNLVTKDREGNYIGQIASFFVAERDVIG